MPKQLTQQQQIDFKSCYDQWTKGRKSLGECEIKWRTKVLPALDKPFINEAGYDGLLTVDYIKGMCEAWRIYHQKKGTEFEYIKRMETWLNKDGWKNSVPNHTSITPTDNSGVHKCLWCQEPVKIKFTLCESHQKWYRENHGPTKEERKEWFVKQGIVKEGMTKTEVMKAYRKSREESLRKLRSKL